MTERRSPQPTSGAVYGLGFIGSVVWWWQQATGGGEHVVAVLKACVWPAFLVYHALQALHA